MTFNEDNPPLPPPPPGWALSTTPVPPTSGPRPLGGLCCAPGSFKLSTHLSVVLFKRTSTRRLYPACDCLSCFWGEGGGTEGDCRWVQVSFYREENIPGWMVVTTAGLSEWTYQTVDLYVFTWVSGTCDLCLNKEAKKDCLLSTVKGVPFQFLQGCVLYIASVLSPRKVVWESSSGSWPWLTFLQAP